MAEGEGWTADDWNTTGTGHDAIFYAARREDRLVEEQFKQSVDFKGASNPVKGAAGKLIELDPPKGTEEDARL